MNFDDQKPSHKNKKKEHNADYFEKSRDSRIKKQKIMKDKKRSGNKTWHNYLDDEDNYDNYD